jgi:hypothetical protein
MKVLKIVMGTYILLNSISLYAESTSECMKYWSEKSAASLKVLEEVECENIWEYGKSSATQDRLKLLNQLKLNPKNNQWMSIDECSKVSYNKKNYYIYRAYYKEDRDEIWIAYNDKSSFSYFRKVNSPQKEGENSKVSLSCAKNGEYDEARSVLNNYLKNNTSVSMSYYKVGDWYKGD